MKKKFFLEEEVEFMSEVYTELSSKLASPKPSTPQQEYIKVRTLTHDKLNTTKAFFGKWLDDLRRGKAKMVTNPYIETWEKISQKIPTKPSTKSLMNNWKKWKLPIKKAIFSNKVYIYTTDLEQWIKENENGGLE